MSRYCGGVAVAEADAWALPFTRIWYLRTHMLWANADLFVSGVSVYDHFAVYKHEVPLASRASSGRSVFVELALCHQW